LWLERPLADREEQRFVEEFVAHLTVEALDEPGLCRLTSRDIASPDASVHLRRASSAITSSSLRTTRCPEINVEHRPQTTTGHVIDDIENAEPPYGKLVVGEVQVPALVGIGHL